MIAMISGKLFNKTTNSAIIDVHGVGYCIYIPLSTYYELPEKGENVMLYTSTQSKDGSISLYGFKSFEEKEVFELLLNVGGIGPKLALNVLSGIAVGKLKTAILDSDVSMITNIPGIGKKTAHRMILELKDKIVDLPLPLSIVSPKKEEKGKDVIAALVNLGYTRMEAKKAVDEVMTALPEDVSEEVLLKQSLMKLWENKSDGR